MAMFGSDEDSAGATGAPPVPGMAKAATKQ